MEFDIFQRGQDNNVPIFLILRYIFQHLLLLPYGTPVPYPAIYHCGNHSFIGNTASAGGRKSGKVASSSGNDGASQRCFNLRLGAGCILFLN